MTQKLSDPILLTLPSDREIVIRRDFNAPRHLVFAAMTQPEHVAHWYGPSTYRLAVCEIDLRPGGSYRYVLQGSNGEEFGFGGVYHEIVPPERLVYTDGFEGMPGHEAVITLTLEEKNGKTMLTSRSVYQSVEDRDAHINSGMEPGMRESYLRLEAHLQTLA